MTDYPMAADFLNPMPAWPVNASCDYWANVEPLKNKTEKQDAPNAALTDRQKLVFTALRDSDRKSTRLNSSHSSVSRMPSSA